MIKLLIDNNADLNIHAVGIDDETPLLLALRYRQVKAAKLLLKTGANVEVEMFLGLKAIHIAIFANDMMMLKLLLKHGANLNAVSNIGMTPLQLAISEGHSKMAEKLIDLGSKINAYTTSAKGPLYRSVEMGMIKVTRKLIQHGADLDKQNNMDGNAPLHRAVSEGYDNIARLLLENGAFVDIKNDDLKTPLHLAAQDGNLGMIYDLLRFNACSTSKDAYGNDPLEYALLEDNEIITKVIAFQRHSN